MATRKYYVMDGETGDLRWLEPPIDLGNGKFAVFPSPEQAAALAPPAYPKAHDAPRPTPPEGKIARAAGWEVVDGEWTRRWEYVDRPLPSLSQYDEAMERHLRREREERGYTTREPDTYLASQVPRWAQDARDWVAHRDAVMEYALELINAVQAGERQPPTMEEFLAGLPRVEWTYVEPLPEEGA